MAASVYRQREPQNSSYYRCVEDQSKDEKETKVFDALEWLAAMCSHVPNKGEQMVRYGVYPPLEGPAH